MLGLLPTDQSLLSTLRAALTSEQPARALAPLLAGSGTPGSLPAQPTCLLYMLEVRYSVALLWLSCPRRISVEVISSEQLLYSSVSWLLSLQAKVFELIVFLHHAVAVGQVYYLM